MPTEGQGAVHSPQKQMTAAVKVPTQTTKQVVPVKKVELEPLGEFNNPYGKPQVAHDDPYLDPFVDDLYLR